MKIVYFSPGHHKNTQGIKLMCASRGVDLVITSDISQLKQPDYNLAIIVTGLIEPAEIPSHVKIIYGPQNFVFPEAPFAGSPREDFCGRCVYNTLSPWVDDLYREFGPMIMDTACLPFAVDVDRFCPSEKIRMLDCIVYVKHREPGLVHRGLEIVRQKGLTHRIFTYGSYSEDDYLEALKTAKFMITFDAHESQGFAIQEAMSCGVPLLVLDATTMFDEYNWNRYIYGHLQGKKNLFASTVPYWSDSCGIKITSIDDLSQSIDRMVEEYDSFRPRDFILENFSPCVCMDRILQYFSLA